MPTVQFNVTKRDLLGKEASKKFRKDGLVPAVVYGKNKENLNINVDHLKLKKIFKSEAGENTIIEMQVEDSDIKKIVLLKEAHLDTLTSNPLHLDFYEINEGEEVKVSCPLKFIGKPEGVKSGGVIQTLTNEVQVQCLPANIPNNIEVEISSLEIGETLRVENIPDIEGVDVISNPQSTVLSILAPRLVVETEAKEDEPSEEEGEGKEASTEEKPTESDKEEAK
ncbi:MAG: 50S ribosomal protein L25 [Thermodesulfobacteriota bacterium]|nr:50S ribosomal protein L25 [Thermodesulfobacteriota bacterium]MEE2975008.1 50S ribosomal protein L25 [Thermodesulfobacteriota bacterium]|tara:strand:+ start:6268 stop:6939 length:672 start_codon:yes stop_codon:yes gene_type:complete